MKTSTPTIESLIEIIEAQSALIEHENGKLRLSISQCTRQCPLYWGDQRFNTSRLGT